jgi:septal ring factor EnvC (AmiA/AmiB activator)
LRYLKIILFSLLLSLTSGLVAVHAQSKEDLEKRKKEIAKEIAQTTKILKETQKNKKATLSQINALKKQIQLRENLIKTISSEVSVLAGKIDETAGDIAHLQAELAKLKKEYAAMVRFAYRNQNAYSKMMFIFAAKNFNQAYKRLKYLQEFSDYRQKQAAQIESKEHQLEEVKTDLESNKKVKSGLLQEEQKEKVTLSKEKEQQLKMASQLTAKESSLKKQISDKQLQARKMDRMIQDIIRKEIEAARKKAEAEAKAAGKEMPTASKTASSNLTLTPEALKLSEDFTANRGRLPWPVEKGTIVEFFGTHEHPQLKGVMVQNNGIDIKTTGAASVRAIFGGTVSGVIQIPGGQNAVLIRHGEYVTVYSNLKSVSVRNGQKVSTKQNIGQANTEEELTTVELQIWKGMQKLNPKDWLAR